MNSPQSNEANMNEGRVIGIDVGYSKIKATTCICILKWDEKDIEISYENVLLINLKDSLNMHLVDPPIAAAAIDGPLNSAFNEIGIYRKAEEILTRKIKDKIGKPGQSSSGNGIKLNSYANDIAKIIYNSAKIEKASYTAKICDYSICEAFPTSFLGVMIPNDSVPDAGKRSDVYFEQLLGPDTTRPPRLEQNVIRLLINRLLPGRIIRNAQINVNDHEKRAGLVCAITALCVLKKKYVAVGDPKNGYIILPPKCINGELNGMQEWAYSILSSNTSELKGKTSQNEDECILQVNH